MSDDDPRPDEPKDYAFSPKDALEFMQKMWNPLGVPLPGFPVPGTQEAPAAGASASAPGFGAMAFPSPAAMFAALDPAEVERKIGELRVIENWLTMTLGMMQMSIKTLELQKASLEALRNVGAAPAQAARAAPRGRKGG